MAIICSPSFSSWTFLFLNSLSLLIIGCTCSPSPLVTILYSKRLSAHGGECMLLVDFTFIRLNSITRLSMIPLWPRRLLDSWRRRRDWRQWGVRHLGSGETCSFKNFSWLSWMRGQCIFCVPKARHLTNPYPNLKAWSLIFCSVVNWRDNVYWLSTTLWLLWCGN